MTEEPDDDLLRRMLDGDAAAFRAVYRDVQPGLLRYVTALVGSADAEDVAAEAWAQAVRDLGRFRGGLDGFRGWMTTIARHRALDLLRSRGRQPLMEDLDDLPQRTAWPAAEDEALTLVSTDAALRLIRTLPPDQAEAVLLRAVMGLDGPLPPGCSASVRAPYARPRTADCVLWIDWCSRDGPWSRWRSSPAGAVTLRNRRTLRR